MILFLGALFLAGLAVALVARAVAMPRMRTVEAIGQIEGYGYSAGSVEADAGGGLRGALDDLANAVGGFAARRLMLLAPRFMRALRKSNSTISKGWSVEIWQYSTPKLLHVLRMTS